MQKDGKISSLLYPITLVFVAILLVGGMFYWVGIYTEEVYEIDVNRGNNVADYENSKIKINSFGLDQLHKSDGYLTVENEGRLNVERLEVKLIKYDIGYVGFFPKDVEYEGGLLGLEQFQVKRLVIYFDDLDDLSNYTRIEVIPLVATNEGNLEKVESAKEVYLPKK